MVRPIERLYALSHIREFRDILPCLLVAITGHPREKAGVDFEIEWSGQSWVHNIFRIYESVFGRRAGIRAELSSAIDNEGNVTYYYHSYEAMFALFEQKIREALKFKLTLPYKIVFPQLALIGGGPMQMKMSPYLFAIAFDASSSVNVSSSTSGQSWAHTCTGTNRLLFTGTFARTSEHTLTGVTYNSSSLTAIDSQQGYLNTDTIYTRYMVAPSTGSNNIATTYSAAGYGGSVATSYTGMKQSGQPEATVKDAGDGSSNNFSLTVTTTAADAWIIGVWQPADGTCSAGSNTTMRISDNDQIGDGGPFATPGSNTINMTGCGNRVQSKIASSFAPNTSTQYTLALAQGSYTLTGQAVGIIRTIRMTLAQGSYALTGQAVALGKRYTIAIAQGAYTLTGQAVSILRVIRMTAAQGSYTLSGQAVTLKRMYTMVIATGSYALTGFSLFMRTFYTALTKAATSFTGQTKNTTTYTPLSDNEATYTPIDRGQG